jgi:hypothetical protein
MCRQPGSARARSNILASHRRNDCRYVMRQQNSILIGCEFKQFEVALSRNLRNVLGSNHIEYRGSPSRHNEMPAQPR